MTNTQTRTCPVCLVDETTTDDLDFHIASNHSAQDVAEFGHGEYVIYESTMFGPEEVMIEDRDLGNRTYDVRYVNSETIVTVAADRLHR